MLCGEGSNEPWQLNAPDWASCISAAYYSKWLGTVTTDCRPVRAALAISADNFRVLVCAGEPVVSQSCLRKAAFGDEALTRLNFQLPRQPIGERGLRILLGRLRREF